MTRSFFITLLFVFIGQYAQAQQAMLEPKDGRVYHGVQMMTYESGTDPLAGYLGALNDSTIQPAVRGVFMAIPGTRGPDNSLIGLKNFFHSADSIGFVPEVSLFLESTMATDSVIAASNQYDLIIDSIITLSKKYGRRMFLRIGGEFNGAGPGWNGGGYHPYLYVAMFRKIVDMYAARGFRDSLAVNWCYEPDAANDFDSVDARGARWYPGDTYVDWFGLDVFDADHFDQSMPDYERGTITRKGKSERFLSLARTKGKPVYLSETSAKGVNISNDTNDGINDWNNWFKKFWEFIAAHKEIKGFGYIDANWPAGAYPNWGDARIQSSQYVTEKYKEEMRKPKYIHLKAMSITSIGQNDTTVLPVMISLWQNYPNPFNPSTNIKYSIPSSSHVTLQVLDVLGRVVAVLVDNQQQAGAHQATFSAPYLSSGIYFYRLQAGSVSEVKPMVLIK
jgi:hypothetical protein